MNANIEKFIESIESPNTAKVVKHVLKNVNEDIENYSPIGLEQFVLGLNPNSPKAIITIIYVISLYSKWLQKNGIVNNDNLYQIAQSLNKKTLWVTAKPNAKKKFISHEEYKRVIHEIGVYEDFNQLYYQCLFSCIFEGVYNEDLSVLKNLRRSDIQGNVLTLHEDSNHIYKLKVSERLANDLIKLSEISEWQRPNRYGICNVEMRGIHSDSVFRIENRSSASNDSYKFSFYAKLRKISKEYLERPLLPLQLYTSGIVARIKKELEKNDISLEEAFADNSRDRMAHLIISKELMRCNSNIEVGNFRELVKGHLDSF